MEMCGCYVYKVSNTGLFYDMQLPFTTCVSTSLFLTLEVEAKLFINNFIC